MMPNALISLGTLTLKGLFQILTKPPSNPSSGVQKLTCSRLNQEEDDSGGDHSYSLQWQDAGCSYHVQYYNVYQMAADPVLVGQSLPPSCVLSLSRSRGSELCVQTVMTDGSVVPLTDCPSCSLPCWMCVLCFEEVCWEERGDHVGFGVKCH